MKLTREQWARVETLFAEALARPVEARRAFAEAQAEEAAVRAELLALVAAAEATGGFLESPVSVVGPPAFEESLPAGTVLGPWRVGDRIGVGGMGEVYSAQRADGAYESEVAVKVLKRGLDTDAVMGRFLRERRVLAQLVHPNIARLLDAGATQDGRPYLVMERVRGQPITDACRARGSSVVEVLRLMGTVCDAVHEAHRNLVVHRDLKPSNVLVSEDGAVKLLDFGIAKLLADPAADDTQHTGLAALTPAYAAPEQLLGQEVTTATDVYALGIVLYQLLTGALPHRRQNMAAAMAALARGEEEITAPSAALRRAAPAGGRDSIPARTARRWREVAGDLDFIVMKALQRESERRYRSAAELGDDLRRLLERRPVLARPDSAAYRARRFVRRHRVPVAAAAVAVAALIGGLGVALWQAARARRAAEAAREEATKSQAIATFVTDVFTAADPEGRQAADLTARELVQRGATRIDQHLAQQPATRAAMLHVLGNLEYQLGLYAPARELLEKALALRRALSPPAPADVAATANALGNVAHRQGRSAEALPLLEEARIYYERAGPAATVDLARDLNNLANVLKALHRDAEARAAFERAIALLESTPAADPGLLPRVLNNYGLFLDRSLRDTAAARVALERALALHERTSGPDSALVVGALGNLSEVYLRLHEVDRAVEASRRVLALSTKSYGPQHYETGLSNNGLGWALLAAGRPAEARGVLETSVDILRAAVGEQHRSIGYAYRNLGQALAETGRTREAMAALRRAENAWTASLGPNAQELGTVYVLLAPLLRESGASGEGERLLARTVELWQPAGPHRPRLGEAWLALARVRLERCRPREAQEALAGARTEAPRYPDQDWAKAVPQLEREAAAARCGAAS